MRFLKKTCALAMVVTMLFTMFSGITINAAEALTTTIKLTSPEGTIEAGQQIDVPIIISDRLGLKGAQVRVTWNPEYLSMSDSETEDEDTGEVVYAGYTDVPVMFNQLISINVKNVADGSFTVGGSKSGSAFTSSSENYSLGTMHFTVLEAAAGKTVEIKFEEATTYGNDGSADKPFASYTGASFTVKSDEPEVPTAESIGLATANGEKLTNVAVKNDNGSEYIIKSALAFVSCVDTDKATPVKTVITREGSDKELVIEAKNKTDINGKTYFVAAVSSIMEGSMGKLFTAKAYAQSGEYLVEGAAATGTYAE